MRVAWRSRAPGLPRDQGTRARRSAATWVARSWSPLGEHIQRLVAVRLQADVLNSELMLVARTDAEAATMIDSNIDPIDHPHIKGITKQGVEPLYEAIRTGKDKDWEERAGAMTFSDAVAAQLKAKGKDVSKWRKDSLKMSLPQMHQAAKDLVRDVYFERDVARSMEGYFLIKGSDEFCIRRAVASGFRRAGFRHRLWDEKRPCVGAQDPQGLRTGMFTVVACGKAVG